MLEINFPVTLLNALQIQITVSVTKNWWQNWSLHVRDVNSNSVQTNEQKQHPDSYEAEVKWVRSPSFQLSVGSSVELNCI